MKKLLLVLMLLGSSLRAMEIRTGPRFEAKAKSLPHLLAIFMPKTPVNETSEEVIASYSAVNQDEPDNQSEQNTSWDILPEELKLYIISFVPKMGGSEDIKNLLLVNHAFKDLVISSQFLKILIDETIKHNPAKALDIYAWAMEQQNMFLTQYIFDSYFTRYIEPQEIDGFDRSNKDRAFAVIISMIDHNIKAAGNVFCAAAAQGNSACKALHSC